jgi:hypothetical protein
MPPAFYKFLNRLIIHRMQLLLFIFVLLVSEKSGTNGNFIFLIFIYRLKLKVKRLKVALILDEKVEIVLSGRQGWCMLLKSEIFVTLSRELQTVVLLSIPIC